MGRVWPRHCHHGRPLNKIVRRPMSNSRTSAVIALIAGPAIGVALPIVQVAFECREPHSEACVWGKALLPVGLAVSGILVGTLSAVVIYALLERRRRSKQRNDGL